MKKHGNKEHGRKRVADEELFIPVRLQSWFWEGKERYWVVDESQQAEPEPGSRARVRVAGEGNQNSPDSSDDQDDSDSQDEVDDQISRDMEASQAHLKEQRLVLLKKVPVVELDSWLRFTGWTRC